MALPKLKDPQATLDYRFDWSRWLQAGDIIVDHEVQVDAGLTKVSSSVDPDGDGVTFWVSGGTAGVSYGVVCHIETTGGRVDERTMDILVEER